MASAGAHVLLILAPAIVAGSLKALARGADSSVLRERLWRNTANFRAGLGWLGFELLPGEHPIIPIMLHDAGKAVVCADALLAQGVYVTAFFYPVASKGMAPIRTQMSVAFTPEDVEIALAAFAEVKRTLRL